MVKIMATMFASWPGQITCFASTEPKIYFCAITCEHFHQVLNMKEKKTNDMQFITWHFGSNINQYFRMGKGKLPT